MSVNGTELICLVDSGATHNFISAATLKSISLTANVGDPLEIILANGDKVITDMACHVPIDLG